MHTHISRPVARAIGYECYTSSCNWWREAYH